MARERVTTLSMVAEEMPRVHTGDVEKVRSAAAPPRPIAIIIGQFKHGGSERQLYTFLSYCDRNRWSPVVYVSGELGFWEEPIRKLNIPVVLLTGGPLAKMWQFRKLCIAQGAKHFFSWSSYTNVYGLALAGLAAHRVGSFRNTGFTDLPSRWRRIWAWASLAGISTAVCNSRRTKTEISQRSAPAKQVVYVPNAIQVFSDDNLRSYREAWRQKLGLSDNDVLVLGVGRVEPAKNFKRFVDVVHQVVEQVPIKAVVAGRDQGDLPAVKAHADQLGLQKFIQFPGLVPDARELICAADIFLLSSDREGMPNVVLEAMAAGVPCVSTNVGAIDDVIENGKTGFIAGMDVRALAQHVHQLAVDPALRQLFGSRARDAIKSKFQPEHIVGELWTLCEARIGR
ncbi:glycosyltransferase [Microvirga sp. HBU67558]|uniref:glycosyltransferase n=1 Tax=Microvirga sp. HBU67558 TaxID=2824562 RepID=UPI001B36D55D|nr:glycosyltransferase [Microvirga sp. HBU67558]MBQ0821981.1 glycosyltransferase [Microvirga sp. HBU67558]